MAACVPIVAQAFRDVGCQVLNLQWNSSNISQSLTNNQAVYDITGLPVTIYQGSTAQLDSDESNYPNDGAGGANYDTQQIRGQHYGIDTQSHVRSAGDQRRLLWYGCRSLGLGRH